MKKALYAGMFDPFTVGHLWVVEESLKLFDELTIAVAHNPEKTPLFSPEERVEMIQKATEHLSGVEVTHFEQQFSVAYAKSVGAGAIVRSIRTESDYEYERILHHINRDIDSSITTVFLMPPRGIAEVSSSMVNQLVGIEGWETVVKKYVPEAIFPYLKRTAQYPRTKRIAS